MQVRTRVAWPLVLLRAARTALVLLAVAVLIRVAGRRPADARWSGSWAFSVAGQALLWSLRVRLDVRGAPSRSVGPALVVANHVSWLDIPVLAATAAVVPVAKVEISRWPVIGPAAGRLGAVFIDRSRLRALPQAVSAMADALRSGRSVQVFPEATTRCGTALDPFRRASFQAAVDAGVPVRPVGLAYLDLRGRPTSAAAFVGDQGLLGSVLTLLRGGPVTVVVRWAAPIPTVARPGAVTTSGRDTSATARPGTSADRRARLAREAESSVARLLGQPVLTRPRVMTGGRAPSRPWSRPAA